MKKIVIFTMLAFVSLSAQAAQKLFPITDGSLTVEKGYLRARGFVKNKAVKDNISFLRILGTVAGLECGQNKCIGTLSLTPEKDLILNARIDLNDDGHVDGREKVIVGRLVDNSLIFDRPVTYVYVMERYSLLERMTGLDNKEFISVSIQKDFP